MKGEFRVSSVVKTEKEDDKADNETSYVARLAPTGDGSKIKSVAVKTSEAFLKAGQAVEVSIVDNQTKLSEYVGRKRRKQGASG